MCSLQEQPFFSIITCLPNFDFYSSGFDLSCAKKWQKTQIDKIGRSCKNKLLKVVILRVFSKYYFEYSELRHSSVFASFVAALAFIACSSPVHRACVFLPCSVSTVTGSPVIAALWCSADDSQSARWTRAVRRASRRPLSVVIVVIVSLLIKL